MCRCPPVGPMRAGSGSPHSIKIDHLLCRHVEPRAQALLSYFISVLPHGRISSDHRLCSGDVPGGVPGSTRLLHQLLRTMDETVWASESEALIASLPWMGLEARRRLAREPSGRLQVPYIPDGSLAVGYIPRWLTKEKLSRMWFSITGTVPRSATPICKSPLSRTARSILSLHSERVLCDQKSKYPLTPILSLGMSTATTSRRWSCGSSGPSYPGSRVRTTHKHCALL